MAEEKVSRKILEDAKKRAKELKEEVETRIRDIEEQARIEVNQIEERAKAEALEGANHEKERLMALAKLELRKSLLGAKRTMIDEAFEKAVTQLNSLKKVDYQGFVKKLLLRAVETGDEEVVVSSEEDVIDQEFLDGVNRELGDKGGLKLSEERREMRGGFVLSRGRVEVKATFDALVDGLRDELEMEVAKILFS